MDAIVALPPQLFLTTGIPACLWFLTRDKTGRNLRARYRARTGETLFIDARKLGTMQSRALRVLTGGEDWRNATRLMGWVTPITTQTSAGLSTPSASGAASPRPCGGTRSKHGAWIYHDIPGFCKAETIESIRKQGHSTARRQLNDFARWTSSRANNVSLSRRSSGSWERRHG